MIPALRIVFLGTPDFAVASLRALSESHHQICGVITAPDRPAGRGRKVQESPVKQFATEKGYPLWQPEKLRDPSFLEQLRSVRADLFVVVAFRMLPPEVWGMPPLGTINLHASLLPHYRGAAPIHWAIIRGELKTGATTFFIGKDIDTGHILHQCTTSITPRDTAGSLHDRLMEVGAELLVFTIDELARGNHKAISQDSLVPEQALRTAPKIFREHCLIDWTKHAGEIFNHIRGLSPSPAAWTLLQSPQHEDLILKIFFAEKTGKTVKRNPPGTLRSDGKTFLEVASADEWLSITDLQLQGKKRLLVEEFLRGTNHLDQCSFCPGPSAGRQTESHTG